MNKFRYYLTTVPTVFVFGLMLFSAVEQGLVLAANNAQITVRQQVTAELSLTVASNALTLSPAIAGLTGGTGNISTVVTIITNNNAGYSVALQASGTGQPHAMKGETQGGYINDYGSLTSQTWVDTSSGQASQFGFGVTNGTLSSANGATGFGTCSTAEHCWAKAPTSTPITIVNVSSETLVAGDTFTLKFRAHIPANSNPLVPEDWYAATTTVTATMN